MIAMIMVAAGVVVSGPRRACGRSITPDLRAAVSAEESVAAKKALATKKAAAEKWDETAKESRWMWSEYQRRWPPEETRPGRQVR